MTFPISSAVFLSSSETSISFPVSATSTHSKKSRTAPKVSSSKGDSGSTSGLKRDFRKASAQPGTSKPTDCLFPSGSVAATVRCLSFESMTPARAGSPFPASETVTDSDPPVSLTAVAVTLRLSPSPAISPGMSSPASTLNSLSLSDSSVFIFLTISVHSPNIASADLPAEALRSVMLFVYITAKTAPPATAKTKNIARGIIQILLFFITYPL